MPPLLSHPQAANAPEPLKLKPHSFCMPVMVKIQGLGLFLFWLMFYFQACRLVDQFCSHKAQEHSVDEFD